MFLQRKMLTYSELEMALEEAVVAYYNVRVTTAEKLNLYTFKQKYYTFAVIQPAGQLRQ